MGRIKAGTPPEVVHLLNTEVGKILAMPETRKKADDAGTTVEQMTPAQLGDDTRKELEHGGQVIKAARITAD